MEVFALVGPSGTGKSHHASLVAEEFGIHFIIDDGLLIKGSRILAGVSAKKEQTALAAVRRAIFADPAHADDVRTAVRSERPERVLVLGTSRDMIHKICDALDLPRPERYIDIEEIASPEEIRRARRIRRQEGKHVIPAPTFEVRKSFSGYIVDPLRFLVRSKAGLTRDVVVEKSMVRPTFSSLGRFFISDTVVGAIAERAACEVAGVLAAHRALVDIREEGVVVVLDLTLAQGLRMQPVMHRAQVRAKEVVESMTALNVVALDVIARKLVMVEGRDDKARP